MELDLIAAAKRLAPKPGWHTTPIPALQLVRADAPYERVYSMHKPSLCFIAQGTKIVTVGEEQLRYGQNEFLYSSIELPIAGEVIEATRSQPYIVLVLEVEPNLVFDLVASTPASATRKPLGSRHGIVVGRDPTMTDAFSRLLRSAADSADAEVLAPLIVREIVYRLLRGPYGDAVREIGIADSQMQRIAGVIEHLKRDYATAQSVETLARLAGMSVSSFHAHFRNVTTLTPLQYQKELRLHEARRLLLTKSTTAADAGFRVGYESASQFSREYTRYFGLPPMSDVRSAGTRPAARRKSA